MPYGDIARQREAQLDYYREHRDEYLAYKKVYNREERYSEKRCKWCSTPHKDRRFRCPSCKRTPRVY